jgi:hypothetical protein
LSLWATVIAAAAGIVAFFTWANRQTAKAHARFTYKDVEIALAELLDPQAHDHDTWDLFLAWPIDDPHLEAIRQECLKICRECPPVPGKDINEEGETRVAALLADLRRRSVPGSSASDPLPTSQ